MNQKNNEKYAKNGMHMDLHAGIFMGQYQFTVVTSCKIIHGYIEVTK